MSSSSFLQWLEPLSAGQSAILVAVGVGLLGLIVVYCCGSDSRSEREAKDEVEEVGSSEQSEKGKKDGGSEPQKKQWKVKNTAKPRRTALPSHSLLKADLKGHTGAVLSLDFDSMGRYLVTCSEGIARLTTLVLCVHLWFISICRSHHSSVVYEDS